MITVMKMLNVREGGTYNYHCTIWV